MKFAAGDLVVVTYFFDEEYARPWSLLCLKPTASSSSHSIHLKTEWDKPSVTLALVLGKTLIAKSYPYNRKSYKSESVFRFVNLLWNGAPTYIMVQHVEKVSQLDVVTNVHP